MSERVANLFIVFHADDIVKYEHERLNELRTEIEAKQKKLEAIQTKKETSDLRDTFAASALVGPLAKLNLCDSEYGKRAYAIAEGMLVARRVANAG